MCIAPLLTQQQRKAKGQKLLKELQFTSNFFFVVDKRQLRHIRKRTTHTQKEGKKKLRGGKEEREVFGRAILLQQYVSQRHTPKKRRETNRNGKSTVVEKRDAHYSGPPQKRHVITSYPPSVPLLLRGRRKRAFLFGKGKHGIRAQSNTPAHTLHNNNNKKHTHENHTTTSSQSLQTVRFTSGTP